MKVLLCVECCPVHVANTQKGLPLALLCIAFIPSAMSQGCSLKCVLECPLLGVCKPCPSKSVAII